MIRFQMQAESVVYQQVLYQVCSRALWPSISKPGSPKVSEFLQGPLSRSKVGIGMHSVIRFHFLMQKELLMQTLGETGSHLLAV